jgi:hypothetical protein
MRLRLTRTPLWRVAAALWQTAASLIEVAQGINDPEPLPTAVHVPRGASAKRYRDAVVILKKPGLLRRAARFVLSLAPILAAYAIGLLAMVVALLAAIVWMALAPMHRARPEERGGS